MGSSSIEGLSVRVETIGEDVKTLFVKDSKRKEETSSLSDRMIESEYTQRGLVKSMEGLADRMDDIDKKFGDLSKDVSALEKQGEHMSDKIDRISTAVDKMTGTLDEMERRQFDWSKFLSGLVSTKGMTMVIIGIISMTVIILSVTAPDQIGIFLNGIKQ